MLGQIFTKSSGLLSTFGKVLSGVLGPVFGPIVLQVLIHVAGKIIEAIAQKNGTIEPEDKVEEVGYRMEEAARHEDWKKMEDFENFHDYYVYLKEQVPKEAIDREKMRRNLLRYTSTGMVPLRDAWAEEVGIGIPDSFIADFSRANLKESEISLVIGVFKALGMASVQFHEFLTGKLTEEKIVEIQNAIVQAYLKAYPDKSALDAVERIEAWKRAALDDGVAADNPAAAVEAVVKDMAQQEADGVKAEDIIVRPEVFAQKGV